MAEYIVQKPVDITKITAIARKSLPPLLGITPKYDGCCCVLVFDGLSRFISAYSSTGELAPSKAHVGGFIEAYWDKGAIRQKAIVGEAWMPGTEFPVINGTFRRKSTQAALHFAPFDIVDWTPGDEYPVLADARPYGDRLDIIQEQPRGYGVLLVPHIEGTLADAEKLAREYKAIGGYDGAIVRDMTAPYSVGRCKHEVVKVKPVLELDLPVTAHAVEPGEKTGRAVVTVEVEYRGVRSWVGSGVPHDIDVAELTPGAIVAIEAMGLTPDGKLREPRFKGIRYDKLEADA